MRPANRSRRRNRQAQAKLPKPARAKKKTKPKPRTMKSERRLLDRLYKAAAAYVETLDGTIVVAGPVSIIRWPSDGPYRYTLGIKASGRVPERGYHERGAGW